MTKKREITKPGKKFLKPRSDVQARQVRQPGPQPFGNVTVDGILLNRDVSMIAVALSELKIRFRVEVPVGSPRELGSSLLDLLLPDYLPPINIEFQGIFHTTLEGQTRDFVRDVNREAAGYRVIKVLPADTAQGLGYLKGRLLELIGTVGAARIGGYYAS